jgi:hypothetical protein
VSGDSASALCADRQAWSKRGVLLAPPTGQPWAHSHAALPVVWSIDGSQADLYYSPRDRRGRAHIACARLEVGLDGALAVIGHDPEPVLAPGSLGAFDDSGVTMSCLAESENATLLYYTGWTLGLTVPFYFYAGLAVRPRGQSVFTRVSTAPILDRDATDPYLTASPWVLYDHDTWRMWYVSCTRWERVDDDIRHYYHLRYAESADGIHWQRAGRVVVDFADEHEYAISRPCVIRDRDRYRMWFAARGDRYRLGYAESVDGIQWQRDDCRADLSPSDTGWDAEMIAYPAIADMGDRRYMLYNGNGYGRTGIGYAISETVA